jgi:hypothetical protein
MWRKDSKGRSTRDENQFEASAALYSPGKEAGYALYRVSYGPLRRNGEDTIPSSATTLISSVQFLAHHSTKLTQLSRLKHILFANHVTKLFTSVHTFFHDYKFRHAPLLR